MTHASILRHLTLRPRRWQSVLLQGLLEENGAVRVLYLFTAPNFTYTQTSRAPKRLPSTWFKSFAKETRDQPSLTVERPLVYLKRFLGANIFGLYRDLANVGGGSTILTMEFVVRWCHSTIVSSTMRRVL